VGKGSKREGLGVLLAAGTETRLCCPVCIVFWLAVTLAVAAFMQVNTAKSSVKC